MRIKYVLNVELFSYKTYDAGLGNLGNEREKDHSVREL